MTLVKIIGFVLCFVFILVLVKQYRPEFVLPLTVCAGSWLFFCAIGQADYLFGRVRDISEMVGIDIMYIEILFKIVGVSYLCEFCVAVCRDCGQTALGIKVELVGKLMILTSAMPVFNELLKIITSILP